MSKREDFLYIVQTYLIAHHCSRVSAGENGQERSYRLSRVFINAEEATLASKRIPDNLSAADAANQFLEYYVDNEYVEDRLKVPCPDWCRLGCGVA